MRCFDFVDLDECAIGDPCNSTEAVTCINSVGSYSCHCRAGYTDIGNNTELNCVDFDECATNTACQNCTNLPGSFLCQCDGNHELRNNTCILVANPCLISTSCPADTVCTRLYDSDYICQKVAPCSTPDICVENAVCTETDSAPYCKCKSGYYGSGYKNCSRIDYSGE